MAEQLPTNAQANAIDRLVDALYDLLHKRAMSIGLLDIAIEADGFHIDCELLFGEGPDMGCTIDSRVGSARYCELIGEDSERWLEDGAIDGLDVYGARQEEIAELALLVLSGLLDARRPLLRPSDA